MSRTSGGSITKPIAGADLVGISTITSTAPRAYAIADSVRGMGIPVLMGGPHVTFLADEALEHADYVIRGRRGEGARGLHRRLGRRPGLLRESPISP